MAKATVQAALGPVCMKRLTESNTPEERHYAEVILMVCILSIVVTAPVGAILISISGTKLLTKTKQLPPTEGMTATTFEVYIRRHLIRMVHTHILFFQVGVVVIAPHCTTSVSLTSKKSERIPNCKMTSKRLATRIAMLIKLFTP